jgi:hypothetical protein
MPICLYTHTRKSLIKFDSIDRKIVYRVVFSPNKYTHKQNDYRREIFRVGLSEGLIVLGNFVQTNVVSCGKNSFFG